MCSIIPRTIKFLVMTKEEKIKEAYGQYWENVKKYVDKNGWCSIRRGVGFNEIVKNLSWETRIGNQYCWRPKSLQGIENNNGWIKIESEEDLPKEDGFYWVIDSEASEVIDRYFEKGNHDFFKQFSSHYQPIVFPDLPLY